MAGGTADLAGSFVVDLAAPDRGIGFCEASSGVSATVRYDELPDRVVETIEVPVTQLRSAALPLETRVWLRNKFYGWWPGRVQGGLPNGDYLIKLAGVERAVPVPPEAIRVRRDRPLQRPDLALAIGMTESRALMDARQPVVRNLIEQRAACHGFTAVLSAAVRPYVHQLEVMARVLGDPVIRYVLADEVGLGKTIEAGLILRQILLDDRMASAAVCVPSTLMAQWHEELIDKLHLGDAIDGGRVQIIEHDDLPLAALRAPSVLIVDEAHQLVERAFEDEAEQAILAAAAQASPALLLLTATPMRGNARTFLGLLHLVDPATYSLDDVAGFQERLDLREEEASAIELLSGSTPPSLLRGVLEDFQERFRHDDVVAASTAHAIAMLEASESIDDRELERLGSHLRETYRISRRVVRTRRSSAVGSGFTVSGRCVQFIGVDDPARVIADQFVDQWRQVVVDSPTAELFFEALERALAGPTALRHFVELRASQLRAGDTDSSATEMALLEQFAAQLRGTSCDARIDTVVGVIRSAIKTGPAKVAVFSSYEEVAKEAADRLTTGLGSAAVSTHLENEDRAHQRSNLDRFRSDRACVVLVCDRSAEEGRNLQNATHLVHLDLPLSINRLEQRIGRVDRFVEKPNADGVPNLVLTESASPWVTAHIALLHDAVQIFDRSVATLTRPLLDLQAKVVDEALRVGSLGLQLDVEVVRDELELESDAIDLLEDVESTAVGGEFTAAVVEDFEDFEESWGETAEAFDRLFSDDGGIRLVTRPEEDRPGVFQLGVDPKLRTVPLMSMRHLESLAPALRGRRTYNRVIARRSPGTRLMRLGDPLVDWIDDYLWLDERGRSSALWRVIPSLEAPGVVFRFDFQVEFDEFALPDEAAGLRPRARRRGDAFLPPFIEEVWIGPDGELAPGSIAAIEASGGSDRTLRGPRWSPVIDLVPDWEKRVIAASGAAREIVLARESFQQRRAQASTLAEADASRRQLILDLRHRRSEDRFRSETNEALEDERAFDQAVVAGVATPAVDMLTATALVLSPDPLDE